jgi:hypothetical protein
MVGSDVPIDGHFRKSSGKAYSTMMAVAGLRLGGDIEDDAGVYKELLARVAIAGFKGVPLGCH